VKKTELLKIVNPAVGIVFLLQALTGIFHNQIPYEIFHSLHGIAGWVLAGLVVAHVYLNWQWVVSTFLKKKSNKKIISANSSGVQEASRNAGSIQNTGSSV
jgi:quinol-cytochrome oxidoreductase complex cytochrome b subunit